MRQPSVYFPCLCEEEKGAVRTVYNSFVPLYFVVPVQPVTDWYNSLSTNFARRQELFERMFDVVKDEVVIVEGFDPVLCYIGFWEFYLSWILYDPINGGTDDTHCRIYEYGQT